MSGDVMKINNKLVQLSRPYQAQVREMVGREDEIKTILVSWMASKGRIPLSPLLLGEPGIGKNRTVYECARVCGPNKELYILQGHEDVTAEDLLCAVRFSDDPARKMDYILSPLATAMVRGMIFFLDGIGKMRKRMLAPLESVLDERRYLDINALGERIYAHAGFRFIAATNPSDMDDDVLPDFIRSRVKPVVPFGYPPPEELDRIIQSNYPSLRHNARLLLDGFWSNWRGKNGDSPPAPRDSIQIFSYAQSLADWDALGPNPPMTFQHNKAPASIQPQHIEQAFEVFHADQQRSG
jgi:MoxR-like ATPase